MRRALVVPLVAACTGSTSSATPSLSLALAEEAEATVERASLGLRAVRLTGCATDADGLETYVVDVHDVRLDLLADDAVDRSAGTWCQVDLLFEGTAVVRATVGGQEVLTRLVLDDLRFASDEDLGQIDVEGVLTVDRDWWVELGSEGWAAALTAGGAEDGRLDAGEAGYEALVAALSVAALYGDADRDGALSDEERAQPLATGASLGDAAEDTATP